MSSRKMTFLPAVLSQAALAACLGGVIAAFAEQAGDVEMSRISGDAEAPRRHFRLREPADLTGRESEEIYGIVLQALRAGYARSGEPVAKDYTTWRRVNAAPYLSSTHGNHYINHYANEEARAYAEHEHAGVLPVGSVIAKDSFSVTETGGILLGPLFVMEKMSPGFSYVSGDWKYSLIQPDGTLFGETNGRGSTRVEYCIACHLAREAHDHLFFVKPAYRLE